MGKHSWVQVVGLMVVMLLLATSGPPLAYAQSLGPTAPAGTDAVAETVGRAFTYQGVLEDAGGPVNGVCDLGFTVWDAAEEGTQLTSTEFVEGVEVREGRFTTVVDVGFANTFPQDVFYGDARWLALEVRCPAGAGDYTALTPRQPVTAVPYAQTLRPTARIEYPGGYNWALRIASGSFGLIISANSTGLKVDSEVATAVEGTTRRTESPGGWFVNAALAPSGAIYGVGLLARGSDGDAADVLLAANGSGGADDNGVIASSPNYSTSDLLFRSNHEVYVILDADAADDLEDPGADELGAFYVRNENNVTAWKVDENGNTTALGTKSAVVDAGDYGKVKLYAVESPESWFEDFGTATLVAGEATVAIEPVFAETVTLYESYHVYLTPLGDCPLYVADKATDAFTVRAMGGATCEIDVDYRIVAKRAGYEDLRLEPVEEATGE